jgi:hypothetical protein
MSDPDIDDEHIFQETWPKKCSCGLSHTEEDWEKLTYVGVQKGLQDAGVPDLELRNCRKCGSTIAQPIMYEIKVIKHSKCK